MAVTVNHGFLTRNTLDGSLSYNKLVFSPAPVNGGLVTLPQNLGGTLDVVSDAAGVVTITVALGRDSALDATGVVTVAASFGANGSAATMPSIGTFTTDAARLPATPAGLRDPPNRDAAQPLSITDAGTGKAASGFAPLTQPRSVLLWVRDGFGNLARPSTGISLTSAGVGALAAAARVASYTGDTSGESLAFLTQHAQSYRQSELDKTNSVLRAQRDFLQEQLRKSEADVAAADAELSAFKREHPSAPPDQAKDQYDSVAKLQQRAGESAGRLAKVEAQLALDERTLATEKPLIVSSIVVDHPNQLAIAAAERDVAELRARGLTENHPDVQSMRRKIAALTKLADAAGKDTESSVSRAPNPRYDAAAEGVGKLRVAAALERQTAASIARQLAQARGSVDKLPSLEAKYGEVLQRQTAAQALRTRLNEQLNAAQIQLDLEHASADARFDLLTPPALKSVSMPAFVVKRIATPAVAMFMLGLLLAMWRLARATSTGALVVRKA